MLGWLYFIASCYIVTFMAKTIYKLINLLLMKLVKLFKTYRPPAPRKDSAAKPEVVDNVH